MDRNESQEARQPAPKITHLQRREIQAPVAACLIRAFARVVGRDRAMQIATEAIQSDAIVSAHVMAEKYRGNSMGELARIVKEVWAEDDALEIDILRATDEHLDFNVTRCRYAELYERMGVRDLGTCLSCSRDGAFVQGFNPQIKLARTQTIMQGASHCDFRFSLERKSEAEQSGP
jgi:hypothetical protein